MSRDEFEREALSAIEIERTSASLSLSQRGLDLGPVELSRQGEGDLYDSELRLYALRDGQVVDALEVHAWRQGRPTATIEQLRLWFRSELDTLLSWSAKRPS